MANEQLTTSSSPTSASEPSSAVQTESESSDGGSDGDDEKPTEQSPFEKNVQSSISDENDQQSNTDSDTDTNSTDDEDKDYTSETKTEGENGEMTSVAGDKNDNDRPTELVPSTDIAQDDDKASIDLDLIRYKNLKIMYEGRNILDFRANIMDAHSWNVQYAQLPQQNYQMYINNRSQYNRLASGYESPENYTLNACNKCGFQYPVMNAEVTDKLTQQMHFACKSNVNELLTNTVLSIISHDSPIQSVNPFAQKLSVPSMVSSAMHTPINLNNFMFNNNAAASANQTYAYQNRNQFGNVAANMAAATATIAANNPSNCFKQNNNSNNNNNASAFYGNNIMLNALVNQLGNNMNNSTAFNSNFMNTINGTNNTTPNQLTQLNNAALANLMNANPTRQQLYGMCRQNINKSGINFNANSHKPMPTYSHF